jgi:hypothetical protein
VLADLSPEETFWERLDVKSLDLDRLDAPSSLAGTHRMHLGWLAVAGAVVASLVAVVMGGLGSTSPPSHPSVSAAQVIIRAQSVKWSFGVNVRNQGVAAGSLNGPFWSASMPPTPRQVSIRQLPLCRQAKTVETLSVPQPSATTRIWYFVLNLHNTGVSCRVDPREWMPEGVTGPPRLPIYGGWAMSTPVLPSAMITWVELHGHATWQLRFRVLSPWSSSFVAQQNSLRGPSTHVCSSLLADGFVEAGLNAGWTDSYFHLPFRVPICREGLFNIQGDTSIIPRKSS